MIVVAVPTAASTRPQTVPRGIEKLENLWKTGATARRPVRVEVPVSVAPIVLRADSWTVAVRKSGPVARSEDGLDGKTFVAETR